jgi:hypothetical protein
MVQADAAPVERVRWTSTRRRPTDDDDDESVLRGGVPMRGEDGEDVPLALDDPWWVKLFGYRSQCRSD